MLKSLIRNPITAQASRDDLAAAEQALTVVGGEFDSAALDAVNNPSDAAAQKRREEASRALAAARERVATLQAAERARATREAQNAAREAAADKARRLAIIETNCKARLRAVADVEAAAKQLNAAWEVISRCSEAIAETGLVRDREGGLVLQSALESELRIAVAKSGLKWAASFWPWPLQDWPAMSDRIASANQHILSACKS